MIDYLKGNHEITLNDYMRLAHVSKSVAEQTLIKLCVMNTLDICYHGGQCYFTLKVENDI